MEKKQVVYELRLSYNGPVSIEEFYGEVEKWMDEKGMQKDIKRKSEEVKPKGKKMTSGWLASLHNAKGNCLTYSM